MTFGHAAWSGVLYHAPNRPAGTRRSIGACRARDIPDRCRAAPENYQLNVRFEVFTNPL